MTEIHIKQGVLVAYGRWLIRFRWLVILLTLLVTFAASYGGQFIGFDTNYRVFFSKENPQLQLFESFQRVFSKNDNIFIVLKPESGDAFDRDTLRAVQWLTEQSWKTPYSSRVDSISNFQHTYAEGDDLVVRDLVDKVPDEYTDEELDALRRVALDEPLLRNRLISDNADTTGVNITVQIPGESPYEVPEAAQFIRTVVDQAKRDYPGITFALSGAVMMNNAFSESSQQDMSLLVPIMYGVLVVGLILFLRSFTSTLGAFLVVGLATMTAMGLTGWLGIKLTPPSATAPTIILTLAIADSIHFLKTMLWQMQKGMKKHEAIVESMRINFQAIFLTSLTTVIGFLSLNFSDAPPFRDLGNITAIGVTAALIYSVTFLPAIMSLLPVRVRALPDDHRSFFEHMADWLIRHHKLIFVSASLLVAGLAWQITRLDLNDQFVRYFDRSIEFRRDTDFMIEHISGIYAVEFPVPAQGKQGVNDPEYLHKLEEFTQWLKEQPGVSHVFSITDIMKRLNKNMHGDDAAYYRIPDDRELASQYLLLYELSLPFGLDLTDRVNVDKSASRVTVTLGDVTSVRMREFEKEAVAWLEKNAPSYMKTRSTGPVVMFSYISERNIDSMMKGNVLAFLLISFSIGIALRSFRLGLISLVPNLIPAVCAFGIWGVLVGQVNMAVAIVAAVSLGIIVDDTVHILSKYRRGKYEKGLSTHDAIVYALSMTGGALVVTTVVLVIGFSVLSLSSFEINASMGMLNAIAIGIALLFDFALLPPLLMMFDRKKVAPNVKKETAHATM